MLPGPGRMHGNKTSESSSATVQLGVASSIGGTPVEMLAGGGRVELTGCVVGVGVVGVGSATTLSYHSGEILRLQNHPRQQVFFLRFRFTSSQV